MCLHTANLNCLAPPNLPLRVRPWPRLVSKTNTTIEIEWNTATLRPECEGVVFDFATLTLGVQLAMTMEYSDATIFVSLT